MGANSSQSLLCKEGQERFAHVRSFVKSNDSESILCSLKKSDGSKSDGSALLLGTKKEKAVKTVKNMVKNTNSLSQSIVF